MKIIHSMPLLIRDEASLAEDLIMAKQCFQSLLASEDHLVVIYNQGCLSNEEWQNILSAIGLSAVILGNGENIGIAQARQACFQYIWDHHSEVDYISEIHVDMIFPANWYVPLIDFLAGSDEPMISPGIVTQYGELQPIQLGTPVPATPQEMIALLESLSRDECHPGFVHPVVHKAHILKEIGGYDVRFFKGKQGYEDDSLLLGYLYYLGTRTHWRPKCYLKSWVYHATMAQRMSLANKHLDFDLNEAGLFYQYGAKGMQQLSIIHPTSPTFDLMIDKFTQRGPN
ncbi:hypothetical protein [Paenibacillus eucommiae]|uniref:Glycosyltransferase n=1 Tax=Paenibacillus eucommiae TaxID=1355755 RepID=A0ABS4ITF7_9BACL|nr:hypothetical protein [Paenibacillus eucommiae]MBP1990857.1 hypothetical protein [Paenibacillus eucommiae]